MPSWNKRSEGRYRRSDDTLSVMLIPLSAGWRYLIYDRLIHDFIGENGGYATAEQAMNTADQLAGIPAEEVSRG